MFPDIASQAFDLDAVACFDSQSALWKIRVVSIVYNYLQIVSALGKTSVLSANDAVVTESTYCDILTDFTPVTDSNGNSVASYNTYVSCCPGCVQDHEDQHVKEWMGALKDVWSDPEFGEAQIESLTRTFVCTTRDTTEEARNSLQPQIADKLNDILFEAQGRWVGDDPPDGLSIAYTVENGCLMRLRDAIQSRARSQNWQSCK